MITLNGVHCNVRAVKNFLNNGSDVDGSIGNFWVAVAPNVMRRVITSPEKKIWLDFFFCEFKHAFEDMRWDIAHVATPLLGLSSRVSGETIFSSAAKISCAFGISSNSIFKVNMRV